MQNFEQCLVGNLVNRFPIFRFCHLRFSSSPQHNQWYYNGVAIPGAIKNFYIPLQDGQYYVIVTSPSGCSKASNTVTVLGVGVNEIQNNNLIELYPNPSSGKTVIHFPEMNDARISVTDVQGRIINDLKNISGNEIQLDVSQWSKGIYLITLLNMNDDLIGRKKLVVQ